MDRDNNIVPDYEEIEFLCSIRDNKYTTRFYGQPLYDIVKPIIDSILPSGGIPCFVNEGKNPSPESTATCLLALSRLKLIDHQTVSFIQEYLFSTNSEVARLNEKGAKDYSDIKPDCCAWSEVDGKNVWSTSQVLWALLATGYNKKYQPVILGAIEWLISQQYTNGGWAFLSVKENIPNIYISCMALYALKLSLHEKWSDQTQRLINDSLLKGCQFIIESKVPKKPYWNCLQEVNNNVEIEPTTTAMAIWALKFCAPKQYDVEDIVIQGIKALRKDQEKKNVWDNKITVDGYSPETKQQKVLQGYTPSIAFILLRLGVDPLDQLVLKSLNVIINSRCAEGWDFYSTSTQPKTATGYLNPKVHYVGSGETMTFTTALSLWTVEEWHKRLCDKNIAEQMNNGNVRLSFTSARKKRSVQRWHLILLLSLAGLSIISLYFLLLYLVFQQSLSTLLANLNIADISVLFDSIVKLLFLPVTICTLLVNFYIHGKFSLNIIKDFWSKYFGIK